VSFSSRDIFVMLEDECRDKIVVYLGMLWKCGRAGFRSFGAVPQACISDCTNLLMSTMVANYDEFGSRQRVCCLEYLVLVLSLPESASHG
jgi:hypothetical protein